MSEKANEKEFEPNDIAKINLAHRRFVSTALTHANLSVVVAISSITIFFGVYGYLGGDASLSDFWRITISFILSMVILALIGGMFVRSTMKNMEAAHKIERKLKIEKILEELEIEDT